MPNLTDEVVAGLTERIKKYLTSKRGYELLGYVTSGGSAAIFKVRCPDGLRAIKVFDPKFISSEEGSKEQQRLELQRRLINHNCEYLVQTFFIETAEDTAFVEMEFVHWPQLKEVLKDVPDHAVASLIQQLVSAILYLNSLGVVHRDIKPENIHVSPDWSRLKLLDLGVVRELDPGPDAGETDQGSLRPFLATAQYSSPEYLFRLDAPSEKLWQALNFYQAGAVLHDLIMKEPIFNAEMEAGNRWLLAKAVLVKPPSFFDADLGRLSSLKSLASRCLSKDMELRLRIVSWADFSFSPESDSMLSLQVRIARKSQSSAQQAQRILEFDREQFRERILRKVREQLTPVTRTAVPLKMVSCCIGERLGASFIFSMGGNFVTSICVVFNWLSGMYERTASLSMRAGLYASESQIDLAQLTETAICEASIENEESVAVQIVSEMLASALSQALDVMDTLGHPEQLSTFKMLDLKNS
ncbi:protein kinase domain-containing protein [Pseudomonas syringae]|uniref:protein kinase domain-containing protein n=1 Tax=Pseudomonas syringae TaxID=317 RepID=UPI000466E087|nr:protein kinase [Pseudomonas syringae]